jgi:type I restriction enzyme S subunit
MDYVTINEVCEILNGYAFKSEKYVGQGIRVIRITNVQKGKIVDDNPMYYPSDLKKEFDKQLLHKGDLLISLTGNVGRVGLIGDELLPAALNQRVGCIRIIDDRLDKKYLFHIFNSNMFEAECVTNSKGIAQKNMSTEWLKMYKILLQPLKVQQQVVEILDTAQLLIDKRKEQIEACDKLIKSRFVEMFGDPIANELNWRKSPLVGICESIVDCPHSTPSYTSENTGYMCIRTTIIKKNKLLWDEIEYIPKEEFEKRIQRRKPQKGDIVYSREGAILGIAAIIDRDCDVALGQRSMLLSPNKDCCCSEFLCVAMNFDSFLNKALEKVGGSASPHINVGDIKEFNLIVPSIDLQNQFATFVQQVDKLKFDLRKSLSEMEDNFNVLMQKAFKGELFSED